jgi:hypothetical protein
MTDLIWSFSPWVAFLVGAASLIAAAKGSAGTVPEQG